MTSPRGRVTFVENGAAMQKKIKNIILDLGGVLLDVDYARTRDAFVDHGVSNFDELYQQSYSNPLFAGLEKGEMDHPEFYDQFRKTTNTNLEDQQIKDAWNAMLGKFREPAIEMLPELKLAYRLYLFSNTNAIHHKAFHDLFAREFHQADFDGFFHKAYYSHLLGHRKPDPESYRELCRLENIDPAETLFVDDTRVNIEGAEKAGLQVLHLPKGEYLEKALPLRLKTDDPETP